MLWKNDTTKLILIIFVTKPILFCRFIISIDFKQAKIQTLTHNYKIISLSTIYFLIVENKLKIIHSKDKKN